MANYITKTDLLDDVDDDCDEFDTWITNLLNQFENESQNSYYVKENISERTNEMHSLNSFDVFHVYQHRLDTRAPKGICCIEGLNEAQ